MSYSELLKPRPEVLSDQGIEGIIDLANLLSKRKKALEKDAERFLALTYPTGDIRRVLEELDRRFNTEKETPGLFLFEGLKGTGKSHLASELLGENSPDLHSKFQGSHHGTFALVRR